MKKIIYLLMSLSLVAFMSCEDDKDSPSNANGTQTENGSKGGDAGSNGGSGDNSGNNGGGNSGSQSAVSVFKSGTENGHDYVDLGLTSGTRWATANVGASKPQDYGNYYAWGETTTKGTYDWSTYKYGSDYDKLTKYCSKSSYGKDGFTDTKTTLDLYNDAAHVNWGGKWRMPTDEQQGELGSECYWVWTESYNNSNVKGFIVYKAKSSSDKGEYVYKDKTPSSSYSLSDAHIFLPAAGYRSGGDLLLDAGFGIYWSSSLDTFYPYSAWHDVCFASDGMGTNEGLRYYGNPVRAVCPAE